MQRVEFRGHADKQQAEHSAFSEAQTRLWTAEQSWISWQQCRLEVLTEQTEAADLPVLLSDAPH